MSAAMHQFESPENRIHRIMRQNEEITRRHLEVERDRLEAERRNASVTNKISNNLEDMMPAERNAYLGRDQFVRNSQGNKKFQDLRVNFNNQDRRVPDEKRRNYRGIDNSIIRNIQIEPDKWDAECNNTPSHRISRTSVEQVSKPVKLDYPEDVDDCFMFSDIAELDSTLPVDPPLSPLQSDADAILVQHFDSELNTSRKSTMEPKSGDPSKSVSTEGTAQLFLPEEVTMNTGGPNAQYSVETPRALASAPPQLFDRTRDYPRPSVNYCARSGADISLSYPEMNSEGESHFKTTVEKPEEAYCSPPREAAPPMSGPVSNSDQFLKSIDFSKPPPNVHPLGNVQHSPLVNEKASAPQHPRSNELSKNETSVDISNFREQHYTESAHAYKSILTNMELMNYPTVNQVAEAIAALTPHSEDSYNSTFKSSGEESTDYPIDTFHGSWSALDVDDSSHCLNQAVPINNAFLNFLNSDLKDSPEPADDKPRYRPILGRGASEKKRREEFKMNPGSQQEPPVLPVASNLEYETGENYFRAPKPEVTNAPIKKKSAIQERMEAARRDTSKRFARQNIDKEGGTMEGSYRGVAIRVSPIQKADAPNKVSLTERMEARRNSSEPLGRTENPSSTSAPVIYACQDIREKEKLASVIRDKSSNSDRETEPSESETTS